jgi:hypothetical protein
MKTGDPDAVWGDREKSCKRYIENRILTASIWSHFKLTPAEQDQICKQGNGKFRVDYSFDKRPKSWSLTKTVPAPPCDCDLSCAAGYDLDNTSSPGHPRCTRLLCRGTAQGIPDKRFGPHDNGIDIWSGNVYHHQPVVRGACHFHGNGRWTPWLNRDAPSGQGDFETLRDFVTAGQACSTPQKIECRRRGTTQLVVTGVGAGGERYTCDPSVGGVCNNRQQTGGVTCSDYEVRFLCP